MVALVLGQSNAANHGNERRRSRQNVFSYYRGTCYEAMDPLPGGSGGGGSVWTRLGDRLIARGSFTSVVFAPVAVIGTSIAEWRSDAALARSLTETIRGLEKQGLHITHVLWHQGEADAKAGTSEDEYMRSFDAVAARLRSEGVTAPIYVSLASRCFGVELGLPVRLAQARLSSVSPSILRGPDTDTLDYRFRYDGCHFSADGLELAADLWLQSLVRQ
jgi:hypothetical protein